MWGAFSVLEVHLFFGFKGGRVSCEESRVER